MYKLSTKFCWFDDGQMIVKMYFINEIPFTFDELPFGHLWDEELCRVADENRTYNPEYMYQMFGYLMMEELHPCLLYTSPSPRDFQVSRMPSSA